MSNKKRGPSPRGFPDPDASTSLAYLRYHSERESNFHDDPFMLSLFLYLKCDTFADKGMDSTFTLQYPNSSSLVSDLKQKLGKRGVHFDVAVRASMHTYYMRNFGEFDHYKQVHGIFDRMVDFIAGPSIQGIYSSTIEERVSLLSRTHSIS